MRTRAFLGSGSVSAMEITSSIKFRRWISRARTGREILDFSATSAARPTC
jgi:hypothetical protein